MVEEAASAEFQSQRVQDDSNRILILLSLSYKKIGSEFDVIVKQCDNVTQLLSDTETHVALIRSVRDEIRAELEIWDELVEDWRGYTAKETERSVAQLLEHTYRFLALNYPIVQVWSDN